MQTANNAAQILDFNAFRQQRRQEQPAEHSAATPLYVWYPVWVFVPNPAAVIPS